MSRRARKYRDSRSWSLPLYYGSGEPADPCDGGKQ